MPHLKAAVFVRPTAENVAILSREFADPQFKEYHLFFSNILSLDLLQALAESDEHEVVKQVQEFYGDFIAVNEASTPDGRATSSRTLILPAAAPVRPNPPLMRRHHTDYPAGPVLAEHGRLASPVGAERRFRHDGHLRQNRAGSALGVAVHESGAQPNPVSGRLSGER